MLAASHCQIYALNVCVRVFAIVGIYLAYRLCPRLGLLLLSPLEPFISALCTLLTLIPPDPQTLSRRFGDPALVPCFANGRIDCFDLGPTLSRHYVWQVRRREDARL